MSRAFDEQFAEAQYFNMFASHYVISRRAYPTKKKAVEKINEDLDTNIYESIDLKEGWIKWHAGMNEDNEPLNAWWEIEKYRKGAQPVWITNRRTR